MSVVPSRRRAVEPRRIVSEEFRDGAADRGRGFVLEHLRRARVPARDDPRVVGRDHGVVLQALKDEIEVRGRVARLTRALVSEQLPLIECFGRVAAEPLQQVAVVRGKE